MKLYKNRKVELGLGCTAFLDIIVCKLYLLASSTSTISTVLENLREGDRYIVWLWRQFSGCGVGGQTSSWRGPQPVV